MIYVSFHDGTENDSSFARNLLDIALCREYNKHLTDFEIIISDGGKPVFKDSNIHFNISHTKNAAAVAVSDRPVGIDIQKIPGFNPKLADRICTDSELESLNNSDDKAFLLYSFWSMRESYVKYTGEGMRKCFRDIPYSGKSHIYRIKDEFVLSVSPLPLDVIFI